MARYQVTEQGRPVGSYVIPAGTVLWIASPIRADLICDRDSHQAAQGPGEIAGLPRDAAIRLEEAALIWMKASG